MQRGEQEGHGGKALTNGGCLCGLQVTRVPVQTLPSTAAAQGQKWDAWQML